MSPILTARARRCTPKLGHKTDLLPTNISDFVTPKSVQTVEVQDLEEPPRLDLADTLYVIEISQPYFIFIIVFLSDLKLAMPPETHTAILTCLKPVTCPDPNYANTNIKRYLYDTSRRPLSPYFETPFVPLFPRNPSPDHTGNRPAPMGLTGLSDLPSHASTVKLEGEEMDLINEHMRVVDGWRTLPANPLFRVISETCCRNLRAIVSDDSSIRSK